MQPGSTFSVSLLIAGTTIGAGVLALPVQTGLAGLAPALVGLTVVWAAMFGAGLILARSLTRSPHPHEDLPGLFCRELGQTGKWLSTLGYLIIFYGLMTAYLSGGVSIVSTLFHVPQSTSLLQAFMNSEPATVPLANISGSNRIIIAGLIFSLCAICTSYWAVSTSLMNFHRDLLSPILPRNHFWILGLLVFLPPFVFVLLSSEVFLTALDVVGGLGIALIFGISPALILLKEKHTGHRWQAVLGTSLLIFFGLILIFELGQEFGLLPIDATVENWKTDHP